MDYDLLRHLEIEIEKAAGKAGKKIPFNAIKKKVINCHARELGNELHIYEKVISSDFGKKGGRAAAEKILIKQFLRSTQIEESHEQELLDMVRHGDVEITADGDILPLYNGE